MDDKASGLGTRGRWDPLIERLHELRRTAGEPSYAELARRVVSQRRAAGLDEHAARIAKSSVHDAFRLGRARVNLRLTRELVAALGADPGLVDEWVRACEEPPAAARPPAPAAPAAPAAPCTPAAEALPVRRAVVVLLACVALNLAGRIFVSVLGLPIHLDMTGTAIAAFVLGPWRGAAVGAATNVLGVLSNGLISLPFALVNVVGALVWGYGVRRWGLGRTLPRFFLLNLLAAVACSLVAVPVILALTQQSEVALGGVTELIVDAMDPFALALLVSNLLVSLADKVITGFVALVVVSALPSALLDRTRLVPAGAHDPGPRG